MNKIIKQELNKITSVKLDFDDNTTSIYIPKTTEILSESLKVGQCYEVQFDDCIIHPDSTSTLSSNWNQGRIPKNNVYVVEVVQQMNTMFKLNGIAKNDQTDNWFGWIPSENIKVIERR